CAALSFCDLPVAILLAHHAYPLDCGRTGGPDQGPGGSGRASLHSAGAGRTGRRRPMEEVCCVGRCVPLVAPSAAAGGTADRGTCCWPVALVAACSRAWIPGDCIPA